MKNSPGLKFLRKLQIWRDISKGGGVAFRPRKGAHLPVYLLCTDPDLPLDRLLQSYLWRWEVELNFRDEKTVMDVGEARVLTKAAVGEPRRDAAKCCS